MSEKTAEEKLREMLEGGNDSETSREKPRVKPSRTRPKRNDKAQRADTLDDLGRRIEESLSAANIQPGHQEKPRSPKRASPRKPEAVGRKGSQHSASRDVLGIMPSEPEIPQAVVPSKPKISQPVAPEIIPEIIPEITPSQHVTPEIVPEVTPSQPAEPEIVPEVMPSQPVTPEIIPEIIPSQSVTPEIVPEVTPSQPVEPEAVPEVTPPHPVEPEIVPEVTPSQPVAPEIVPEVTPSQPVAPEIVPEITPSQPVAPEIVPEITPSQPVAPEIVPEITPPQPVEPEIVPEVMPSQPVEPEIVPEIIAPDTAPEIPEIPVIEAEAFTPQDTPEIPAGLPDIPLIEPDEDYDEDNNTIFVDDFTDIPVMADESNDDTEPQQEHEIPTAELQESELFEVPEAENEFDDIDIAEEITPFDDEPLDESPAIPDEPEAFTPEADIVVNVNDDIPSLTPESPHDPEAESVPVTVAMPESTKTAEDKLMADIAEAMTGSPLSLDSQEAGGLYNIPAGFFTEDASDSQSAEDKLKANIVQALSESPINTAHEQARQNLEADLNPFDEMTDITYQTQEPETPAEIEPEQEEEEFLPDLMPYSENEPQEEIIPEFDMSNDDDDSPESEPEIEPEPDIEPEFDAESEPEITPEPELDLMPDIEHAPEIENEPEIISEAEPEITLEPEAEFEPEISPEPEPAPEIDTEPEIIPESAPAQEPEPEDEPDPFTIPDMLFDDDEPETPPANHEPLTEQERLAQEVAAMTQEFDAEIPHEEAQPENEMPDQNLIDTAEDIPPANEDADEFDISSLGGAAEITEHDPDPVPTIPGTVTEVITEQSSITRKPENQRKEKIMGIREKLASRKNGNSSGGIMLPLLLGAVIIIGGLIVWQLMQLSDKLTSLAMNSGGDYSSSYEATPSYSYAIDFILDPNLTDRMAQRGRDGWQVVGSRRTQDSTTGQYGYEFIFMRRIPGR